MDFRNIHPKERIARIIAGTFLITLAFIGPESPWFLLGIIPFLTGIFGWCPPYQLLGINTARGSQTSEDQ